jgi:hypothetical protein
MPTPVVEARKERDGNGLHRDGAATRSRGRLRHVAQHLRRSGKGKIEFRRGQGEVTALGLLRRVSCFK